MRICVRGSNVCDMLQGSFGSHGLRTPIEAAGKILDGRRQPDSVPHPTTTRQNTSRFLLETRKQGPSSSQLERRLGLLHLTHERAGLYLCDFMVAQPHVQSTQGRVEPDFYKDSASRTESWPTPKCAHHETTPVEG
jgi:hypothetical protein